MSGAAAVDVQIEAVADQPALVAGVELQSALRDDEAADVACRENGAFSNEVAAGVALEDAEQDFAVDPCSARRNAVERWCVQLLERYHVAGFDLSVAARLEPLHLHEQRVRPGYGRSGENEN